MVLDLEAWSLGGVKKNLEFLSKLISHFSLLTSHFSLLSLTNLTMVQIKQK
jgi:hypothetical protein